jgi:hypothetical protein
MLATWASSRETIFFYKKITFNNGSNRKSL